MSVMTESSRASWRPMQEVTFIGRKPKTCSVSGCRNIPTQVRITHLPGKDRRFVYCDDHLMM